MDDVVSEIRRRIGQKGAVTFAEFMDVALYWPHGGYYTLPRPAGAQGDYFTAPSTHPLFGTLIALQVQQVWQVLGDPSPFWVVELGAGNGLLGHDVLASTPYLTPEFGGAVRYVLIDRVATPGVEGDLPPPACNRAHRMCSSTLPLRGVVGCVVANELLDSLPVHRVTVRDGRLRELYVTVGEDGAFQEVIGEPSTPALAQRLEGLGIALPEGYRSEVNLCLEPWLAEVAAALEQGLLLVIDYGHPAGTLYSPERSRGTLRCYYRHTLNANPYQHVGRQDISVHVDLTTLEREAKAVGLSLAGNVSQREFLTNLGFRAFLQALARASLDQRRKDSNRMAMLELVKSEGMGQFRVVAFWKGVDAGHLYGLASDNPLRRRLEAHPGALAVPLATPHHVPLLQGTYPWMDVDWEEAWR